MKKIPLNLLLIIFPFFLIFSSCVSREDYRKMTIDPAEVDMGYLSSENGHCILPFVLGGYTKGPKSLLYSAPLLSWYVNSKQHKGFAFLAPFVMYNIDTIYYWSDNMVDGYSNLTFWFLGLIGSTESITGMRHGEEVHRYSYWFFPLFKGGENEDGFYLDLFMLIPLT